jgi:16S rRNA (uracil1498-N3)-methyltransferase
LRKGNHLLPASKYSDYFCTVDFLFYTTDIRANTAFFPEEESRHMASALRLRFNDKIQFTDGIGHCYKGVIQSIDKKTTTALIMDVQKHDPISPGLELAVAITKQQERLEWCLEKAVELGISRFIPFVSRHCERKTIKEERLKKIAISAMKQSGQYFLPVVEPLKTFKEVISDDFSGFRGLAYLDESDRIHISNALQSGISARIIIGPEGDFTREEVELARAASYDIISLGGTRLRTESAAVFAAAAFKTINTL